jgi:hypothetical protein
VSGHLVAEDSQRAADAMNRVLYGTDVHSRPEL